MKIIQPSAFITHNVDGNEIIRRVEAAGRVCYKSEDKNPNNDIEISKRFVASIIKRGHEAVIEHANITAKFICDRGVTHEIVRHRVASYCQESTRYCNYSGEKFGNEITVIEPPFWDKESIQYKLWKDACQQAEGAYFDLLQSDATPQEARSVLPNSLKAEILMTCNMREWRHFFKLRCSKAAHPQMQQVAKMLLKEFHEKIPILFDDLAKEFLGG